MKKFSSIITIKSNSPPIKMLAFTSLILILYFHITGFCLTYTSPSKGLNYTLNLTNLIINPDISSPDISGNTYHDFLGSISGWTTKGSIVEYINACVESNYWGICNPFKGVICGQQFIDVDSVFLNEQVYQNFTLTAGRSFQLKFDWITEVPNNPDSTGMEVLWNNITVFTIYDGSCTLKTEVLYLTSINGVNQIVFQGMGAADSQGIMIRNIFLQELVYPAPHVNITSQTANITSNQTANITSNQTSNLATNSTANLTQNQTNVPQTPSDPYSWINSLQYQRMRKVLSWLKDSKLGSIGSRQNLRFLLGYALEVNHLLLYNYHLRNSTPMATLILAGAKDLYDQKGLLLDHFIYPLLGTSPAIAAASHSLPAVINPLPDYSQRPMSALLEGTDLLLLDLPVTLLLFAIGHLLFKALFRRRISLLFRQYSLWTYLLCVLLDGRVEIATFCFCSEALMLANTSFRRKAQAAAVLLGYFLVFSFAVASMLLYRAVSRRLKYVYQNCGNSLSSSLFMCYHFGLYNICLGFVHRLLLPFPLTQLSFLFFFEAAFLIFMFRLLLNHFYCRLSLALILLSMNSSRLALLLTYFAFQMSPNSQADISPLQQFIFYSFLFFWALSVLVRISEKLSLIISVIVRWIKERSNKVAPLELQKSKDRICFERNETSPRVENEITSLKQFVQAKPRKVKKQGKLAFPGRVNPPKEANIFANCGNKSKETSLLINNFKTNRSIPKR